MRIGPGSRLGSYDVIGPLGVGGMGEVYRARDARLHREVALKVLPEAFASDPERLARFEREAQALAALKHPHIATIYGIEENTVDGGATRALVLELVDGETLQERIARAPLTIDEAIDIARQVADALEAAHEHGIVHRDLKPANIKIAPDGVVKVLDFGLARFTGSAGSNARFAGSAGSKEHDPAYTDATSSPTMTTPALVTGAGALMGTASYMAPEQARGKIADKRADIWAFGVVLFEMIAGARPFEGETVTEVAGAVIHTDPDWTRLPATTPVSVRMVLERCLQKDVRQRFRDMGDVRLALAGAFTRDVGTTSPHRRSRGFTMAALAGVALIAAIATGLLVWTVVRPRPEPIRAVRFHVPPPAPRTLSAIAQLSPNGRYVVFMALDASGVPRLWLHEFASGSSLMLANAGRFDGSILSWSPDSRFIAYGGEGKLKTIDLVGGAPETLASISPNYLGASWNANGTIVMADARRGIMRISSSGGAATPVTTVDAARNENTHALPWFLPDGRHFLYLRFSTIPANAGVFVGDVDASPDKQDATRLLNVAYNVAYVPVQGSSTGMLVFVRNGLLMAQPFDPDRRVLSGEATRVVEEPVRLLNSIYAAFSVSETNALTYFRSTQTTSSLVWVNRKGEEEPIPGAAKIDVQNVRLSPDGHRLALIVGGDLWTYDTKGRPPIKLTFDGERFSPLWTPDGTRIVYEQGGGRAPITLFSIAADGSGGAPQAVAPAGHFHPHGWAEKGSDLIAARMTDGSADLLKIRADPAATPEALQQTPANEGFAATVSPDGRWVAYTADTTGRFEIWVRPLSGPGSPIRVSPNTGSEPMWSRNGRELYYREGSMMMAVPVEIGTGFNFKPPVALFRDGYNHASQPPTYDVTPDGRFVMLKLDESADVPITVVLNWTALLRAASSAGN